MTEKEFQDKVVSIAKMYGWLIFHPTPHKVGQGWRTDGRGFPDLVLAHRDHGTIFAELKTQTGRLNLWQKAWQRALEKHGEYYIWRPEELPFIISRLRGNNESIR